MNKVEHTLALIYLAVVYGNLINDHHLLAFTIVCGLFHTVYYTSVLTVMKLEVPNINVLEMAILAIHTCCLWRRYLSQ